MSEGAVWFLVLLLALGALRRWAGARRGPARPEPPDAAAVAARLLAEGPALLADLRRAGLPDSAARLEQVLERARRWLPGDAGL